MPAPDDLRGTPTTDPPAATGLAPGALSALLVRLAQVPAPDPGAGWGLLPEPGTAIGRFELVREIGRGGFGVVYEARDRELPRSVAFKLVRPGLLEVGEAQLQHEADAIAQLSHPNLVTLYDVGRCEFGPYLILELLRGETLDQRLRRGPLPARQAVALATDIARGMGHAHAQGVIHRDLKPSNVFLCQDGQVKLLDFGMSHAFGRQRLSGGTPGYMAPEQWRGQAEDERTDVYALGVLLFQALSGRLPFPGDADGAAVLSDRPAPALATPEAPRLAGLVARLLEKEPGRRPRGAPEVLAALEEVLAPPAAVRGRLGLRSRPVLLLLLGAAALAATLALVAVRWPPGPPTPRPARAIAVLPFHDLGGSADTEYFSDGLTEEIRHRLTRVRELRVAAGSTTFPLKGTTASAAEVARRLGVDVVLEGSVRREKDQLRVSAELVDARTGFRLWSQIYDRRLAEVFAIQEDIARQVVGSLELVLSSTSRAELDQPEPASLEAYDLYLRGRAALRRPATRQTLEEATRLFERAIAADGRFAVSYAGLCDAWLARFTFARAAADFERAEQACQVALDREPQAAAVHQALASLHLAAGDADRAGREFTQAASLATNPVEALLGLARAVEASGRTAEVEAIFERARQADPSDWQVARQVGNFLFRMGRHAEAATVYAEVVTRTPDSASAHGNLGAARYLAGDFQGAVAALETSVALGPTQGALSNLGSAAFYLGRFEEAAARFRKAAELAPGDHVYQGNLGDALTFAGGRAAEAAGAYRQATALAEQQLAINREDDDTRSDLARYQARLGRAERARQLRDEALRRAAGNLYVQYNAALVSLQLGALDEALAALERAVALGYQRRLLSRDAALAPLRGLPRFEALAAALPAGAPPHPAP
ncbi:MAG: protein kinase [Anaeromyxobacter sp.]|nr:protein kinase [Anaeromyxobacter sp.]MBL0275613.1 protein kinase [Anaeromyxobacter sp.]